MFTKLMKKKRVFVGLSVVVLAVAGAAFAFFTSTGSGTGHGTVGTATTWEVIPANYAGTMLPGAGESTFTYTVKNNSTGSQGLTATSATVAKGAGGGILENKVEVVGCEQSWFTATDTPPAALPQNLAAGASSTEGKVKVTMANVATSQDACKERLPDITVTAS